MYVGMYVCMYVCVEPRSCDACQQAMLDAPPDALWRQKLRHIQTPDTAVKADTHTPDTAWIAFWTSEHGFSGTILTSDTWHASLASATPVL